MKTKRSFRVSDNFQRKFEELENEYKREGIEINNEKLLDEMIDSFYAIKVLGVSTELKTMFSTQLEAGLERYTTITAKMHNAILEEVRKK